MEEIKYTSQIGQDKWVVEEVFKGMTNGFFIELGAGDGIQLSNTYVLETMFNWDGICVEPNTVSFEQLKNNRKCKIDNSFILDGVQEIMFHQYSGNSPHWEYFSSMHPLEAYENNPQITKQVIKCPTISLGQLLDKYNVSNVIHYLSVDTEYTDYDILNHYFTNEVGSRTIVCISVEHNFLPVREKLLSLLTSHRFIRHKELFHDDLYLNQDFINLTNL